MSEEIIEFHEDDKGYPILLARAPGQVADQGAGSGVIQTRATARGNPQFDPATGRFAGSGTTVKQNTAEIQVVDQVTRTLPQGVDPAAWNRRLDIIRELARTSSAKYDDDSLTSFLKSHPNVQQIASIDLDALRRDIRAQQIDDLIDLFDAQLSATVDVKKNVRLAAPARWVKDAVARFTDEEMLDVAKRLSGRGYGDAIIKNQVVARITDKERRTKLEQLFGETKKAPKKSDDAK